MKVVAFTGMPGSGKSVITEALKTEGYLTLYMGVVVKNEMAEENIAPTGANVRNYATELRKKFGDDVIAKRCLPELKEKIKRSPEKPVIIEDIKGIAEVEFFRNELGEDFVLIAVHTSPKLRFKRSQKRGAEWDDKTTKDYEQFQWRDRKEMAWGLSEAIAIADHIIVNNTSEDELIDKVKKLLNQIEA